MLGKLTIDALPYYSDIAVGGALITVLGALGVVALISWLGQWRYLWTEWLTSLDHKKIGIMYVALALIMLVRGFLDALLMRTQQAVALDSHGYLTPDHFDQIFTSHATIMVFFVAMPFLVGLFNVVVPQQIGARDMAFPFMNSASLWLTASGAALVMISLVIGKFSTAGWGAYPPYSEAQFSPGVGVDYWIWAVLVGGVGSMLSTRLSSWLRSVKLAPAVRTDRVDHDFARGRRHKLNAGRAFLVIFWGILIFGYFVT